MVGSSMYRAAVSPFTSVPTHDGGKVKSKQFPIRRGGDIRSLLYFILVFEMILHKYDPASASTSLFLAKSIIKKLAYADDVVLFNHRSPVQPVQ